MFHMGGLYFPPAAPAKGERRSSQRVADDGFAGPACSIMWEMAEGNLSRFSLLRPQSNVARESAAE